MLDYSSDHSLLYTIKIINEIRKNQEVSVEWNKKFVKLGGFTHLLKCFLHMELHKIENSLSHKCIDSLIMLIYEFQNKDNALKQEMIELVDQVTPRCLQFIHMISLFTIK